MREIKESDWKVYRELHGVMVEKWTNIMNWQLAKYLLLLGVGAGSWAMASFVGPQNALTGIYATPGIAALIATLYFIFRDDTKYKKDVELQRHSQVFSLGATSHMANVAFDKHVEFCEQFLAEVHEVMLLLFQKGPTLEVTSHIERFGKLQRKYSAWIPREMALQLAPFTETLHNLAAKTYLAKALENSDDAQRIKAVKEMFDAFQLAMRIGRPGDTHDGLSAGEQVKERIRAILGIEQLTFIRRELINQAAASLGREPDPGVDLPK